VTMGLVSAVAFLCALTSAGMWWQTVESALGQALAAPLNMESPPALNLQADPFLTFPRGHIPRLATRLDGVKIQGVPLPPVKVVLTDVQLAPQALLGLTPARLCAPARVLLAASATADEITQALRSLTLQPQHRELTVPSGPLRKIFGASFAVNEPRVALSGEAVRLTATLSNTKGQNRKLTCIFALKVVDEKILRFEMLEMSIDDRRIPAMVLRMMTPRLPPLLDLTSLSERGTHLHIAALELAPEELTLRIEGELAPHPTPWLRPPGLPALQKPLAGE
jgi:hypothetical protein